MATLNTTRSFDAPPQRVFDAFTDLRKADQHITAIKKLEVLTDGPIRKGTRFRETRTMFKRDATETMEVVEFDPIRGYAVGCNSCGVDFKTTFRFVPEGAGTRVEMELVTRPISLFAKLMSPLSGLMMGPMMRKCIEQDMDDLRKAIEATPA